jgi:hypothetical protein
VRALASAPWPMLNARSSSERPRRQRANVRLSIRASAGPGRTVDRLDYITDLVDRLDLFGRSSST